MRTPEWAEAAELAEAAKAAEEPSDNVIHLGERQDDRVAA